MANNKSVRKSIKKGKARAKSAKRLLPSKGLTSVRPLGLSTHNR
jgi:hypothetical protein